jgi:hypothetical protein
MPEYVSDRESNRQGRENKMPKPDVLDVVVSVALVIALLVVAPVFLGRSVTPHVDGEPLLLSGTILDEQRYISKVRGVLQLCSEAQLYLEDLPPAEQAFAASAGLQRWVDEMDKAWAGLDETEAPGRFASLHEQMLALVKLYRYLVGEAWAYYGDLDETHLADVRQGLVESDAERTRLEILIDILDFEGASEDSAKTSRETGASDMLEPTPVVTLPEWE